MYNSVFDNVGYVAYFGVTASFYCREGAELGIQRQSSFYKGVQPTVRKSGVAGSAFWGVDCRLPLFNGGNGLFINFIGMQDPVIVLEGSDLDTTLSPSGLTDGGGNLDVGIKILGARCTMKLNTNTDVGGALGQLEVEGVIGPFSDLPPQTDPLITEKLNVLSRG